MKWGIEVVLKYVGFPICYNSLEKELNLQDKMLGIKLIKGALDKRERKEVDMDLQHIPNCVHVFVRN